MKMVTMMINNFEYEYVQNTNKPRNPGIITDYRGEEVVSACLWKSLNPPMLTGDADFFSITIPVVMQTIASVFANSVVCILLDAGETSSSFGLQRVKKMKYNQFPDADFIYEFQVPIGANVRQYFAIVVRILNYSILLDVVLQETPLITFISPYGATCLKTRLLHCFSSSCYEGVRGKSPNPSDKVLSFVCNNNYLLLHTYYYTDFPDEIIALFSNSCVLKPIHNYIIRSVE